MKTKLILITILIVYVFLGCSGDKDILSYKIKGPRNLLKAIQEVMPEFNKQYPYLRLTFEPVEDARAIASYLDGTCDFAIAGRLFNTSENNYAKRKNKQVQAYQITRDAVAVIVSKENPIDDLQYEVIKNILSYKTLEWTEVIKEKIKKIGYNPLKIRELTEKTRELSIMDIEVCLLNNLYSIHEYLLKKVNMKYFSTNFSFFKTTESIIKTVAVKPKSVGFVPASMDLKQCKILTIDSVEINRENIINKKYPLSITYHFFLPRNYKGIEMIDFVFFLRSPKVRKILNKRGFVRP